MFQPQNVTCPKCGNQHQIITEDIPSWNIDVCRLSFTPGLCLFVYLKCPDCYCRFNLCFIEKSKVNSETLFESIGHLNAGLQMWKKIEGHKIMIPTYHPNVGNRTAFESMLDDMALAMANKIYPWQDQAKPAKTLADYLGEVDDYTKRISWKNLNNKPLIVAYCAHDCFYQYYRGTAQRCMQPIVA